jgi:hypothetical protein
MLLDRQCADDPALQARIEARLAAHERLDKEPRLHSRRSFL